MRFKSVAIAVLILTASFFISLQVMDWMWPPRASRPALVKLPPLPPAARKSEFIAPVTIPLGAIASALDRAAPRDFGGKADNPVSQILSNADIGWHITRGAITASGEQNALTLSTPLDGKLTVTGSLSTAAGSPLNNTLGDLFGAKTAQKLGNISIKSVNANAAINGTATATARPHLTPDWHVDPQLTAQVTLANNNLSVAGAKVAVPAQVKPVIDKTVNEQIGRLQQRLRNDDSFRRAMQQQWARACKSFALPPAAPGTPPLFLEMRPVRAVAAQPQIDHAAVKFAIGLQAETKIADHETAPQCPFPATLEIRPMPDAGRVNIGVPIDMPFAQLSKIAEAELKGRTFPEDGSGAIAARIDSVDIDASGDRLLVSLLVHAAEKASWFGLGADATVRIWCRPVLDRDAQMLRLSDLSVAVTSDAAFGLFGALADRAAPYLKQALEEHATIDLKPLAVGAQQKLAAIIGGLQTEQNGVRIDAGVTQMRLGDVSFDSATLRVIAEATGTLNITVNQLPSL
ncbi:hypothetical protein AFEL58S_01034 [Afipia felis]